MPRTTIKKYTALEYYNMTDSQFRELYESESFQNLMNFLETRVRLEIINIIRRFRLKGDVLFEVRQKTTASAYAKLQRVILRNQADFGARKVYLFEILQDLVGARLICMHDEAQKKLFDHILQVESLAIQATGLEYYTAPFREYTLSKDIHDDLSKSVKRLHEDSSKGKTTLERKSKSSNYESLHFYVKFGSQIDEFLIDDLTSTKASSSKNERVRDKAERDYLAAILSELGDREKRLISEIPIEFQIRTITDHLWAQEEHRYVYKNSGAGAIDEKEGETLALLKSAFTGLKFAYFNVERLRSLVRSITDSRELPTPSYSGSSKDMDPRRFAFFGNASTKAKARKEFQKAERIFLKADQDLTQEAVIKALVDLNRFISVNSPSDKVPFDPHSWGQRRLFYLLLGFTALFSTAKSLPAKIAVRLNNELGLSDLVGDAAFRASVEDEEGSLKLAAKLYERVETYDGFALTLIGEDDELWDDASAIFKDPLVRIRLASSFFLQNEFAGARRALLDLFHAEGRDDLIGWTEHPLAGAFSASEMLMRYSQYIFFESFEDSDKLVENFQDLIAASAALFSLEIDEFNPEHYRSCCWYYSLVNFLFTQEVLVPPALTEQSGECKEYLIRFFADASDTFIVEKPEVQLAMIMLRVKVQPQKKGRIAMVKEDHEALRTGLMDNTSYPRLATRYLLAMGGAIRKRSERKVRRTPGTTFLSYTKDNAKKARNIVDTLGEKGLNVVYDAQFDPGEPIARQVEVAMINASTAILLLTKEYLNSSWASDERDFLMDKRRRKELRLFVLNDGVTQRQLARKAPLLSGLLHLSGTDADLEESLQRLVEEIGQLNPDRS